jgi:MFS transporter, DHA1 family, tetracycline resistance protein
MTSPPTHNGALLALFLVVFVSMTGFGLVVPIAPFFGLHLGASATEITYAIGAYSLAQLIAAPLWGRLSDRIGRRPVLIVSLLLTAAMYIALSRAESILDVGLARFAAGLAAGNIGAGFAAAADISTNETRARAMGIVGAGFALGFIVGPAIGGFAAGVDPGHAEFARVCYVACGLALIAAVVAFFLLPESRPANLPPRRAGMTRALLSRPVLLFLCMGSVMGVTGQAMVETTFGLWAEIKLAWTPPIVGVTFGTLGLSAAALQGMGAGPLARRFGAPRLLILGYVTYLAGFSLLAMANAAPVAIAGMTLLGIGAGLIGPAIQTLVSLEANDDERGAVQGVYQSALALGRVFGPLLAGPLFDGLGASAPFAAGAVLSAVALGFASVAMRTRARRAI